MPKPEPEPEPGTAPESSDDFAAGLVTAMLAAAAAGGTTLLAVSVGLNGPGTMGAAILAYVTVYTVRLPR